MEVTSSLTVDNLSKHFGALKAVDEVSLHLETGEILGLIGPNGSGKTTLINIITGMLPKNSGHVIIDGHDITAMPAYKISHMGLVRTYQTIRLFKNLNCLENVEVGAIGVGSSRRKASRLAEELCVELGLGAKVDLNVSNLTFKEQRLLEIARALAAKPKFLLLDEPAAGLNEHESDELLALLRPMPAAKHIGILIVDHDMRLMMKLCDRLQVLNYGRTIAEGFPEAVRKNHEVIKAYLGSSAA